MLRPVDIFDGPRSAIEATAGRSRGSFHIPQNRSGRIDEQQDPLGIRTFFDSDRSRVPALGSDAIRGILAHAFVGIDSNVHA